MARSHNYRTAELRYHYLVEEAVSFFRENRTVELTLMAQAIDAGFGAERFTRDVERAAARAD